jgi:SARP family transcriptional regulator, regulator of embCAB operon
MPRRGEASPDPAQLRVYVCGRLAVERGEAVLPEGALPARQGRRLWAFLVLHRQRPVSRDHLANAVWGEETPDARDAALNALVSRLRAALRRLGGSLLPSIRGEVGRYELALPVGSFVDFERARTAIHEAETLMRAADIARALAEARVAMEIALRSFLPGEEGAWVEGARRELGDMVVRALEITVECELLRGSAAAAEREARYLLGIDPLRESGYRLLMRALVAGGNTAQVSRVMLDCRRILGAEAGVPPSAETERVFRELVGRCSS